MKLFYDVINSIFGTYYGVDAKYQHMTVIKRKKNPSFPKLRGLIEIHAGDSHGQTHREGAKLYYSKYKVRRIANLMEKVDEEYPVKSNTNLAIEFPQASKRPLRKFPD